MSYEEINALLDRYWEGETSIEEERQIKRYFAVGPVDPRLQAVSALFQAISEEKNVQYTRPAAKPAIRPQMYQWAVAASLALGLGAALWLYEKQEPTAPMAALETPVLPQAIATAQPPVLAAVAQPMVQTTKAVKPAVRHKPKRNKPDKETEMAMAEIKAALALVSSKLSKGKSEALKGAALLETLDKVPKRGNG